MGNRAYVYCIEPDRQQEELIHKTFGCARFVYNQVLALQEELYQSGSSHMNRTAANTYCNKVLKEQYPFLREVDKFALTNSIYHLEDGYRRMFSHLGKHPKFKSKRKSRKSYTTNLTNGNIEIGESYVKLPKLGKVRAVVHRIAPNDWQIKSATVSQTADGKYQVSVLFQIPDRIIFLQPVLDENTVGLDYKSDGLYADSSGVICGMPHFYRKSAEKLAKQQRKLKHMTAGSSNYKRQQKKIAKTHRHTANQRKDYLHKQSAVIAKQYGYVCVEDLNMKAMSNKGFGNGKATLDNGYGMFLNMLSYKLAANGGALVKVDRFFPSSQLCSCCGYQNSEIKNLLIRKWRCPQCGTQHDRDFNAAVNIKMEGIRLLTKEKAA